MLGCIAGTMTISQVVPFARSAGFSATAAAFAITDGRCGQRARALPVRVDVRPPGPSAHGARRAGAVVPCRAPALYFFRESVPALLRDAVHRVLRLRHAAVGLHGARRRLLRSEALGGELRHPAARLGHGWHLRTARLADRCSPPQATISTRSMLARGRLAFAGCCSPLRSRRRQSNCSDIASQQRRSIAGSRLRRSGSLAPSIRR